MEPEENPDMELTITQAAVRTGKDRSTIFRAIKNGKLWGREKLAAPPMTGTFWVTTVQALDMWVKNEEAHKPGKKTSE